MQQLGLEFSFDFLKTQVLEVDVVVQLMSLFQPKIVGCGVMYGSRCSGK